MNLGEALPGSHQNNKATCTTAVRVLAPCSGTRTLPRLSVSRYSPHPDETHRLGAVVGLDSDEVDARLRRCSKSSRMAAGMLFGVTKRRDCTPEHAKHRCVHE